MTLSAVRGCDAEAAPTGERPARVRELLGIYAASRLLLLVASLVVTMTHRGLSLTEFLTRWDAGWYLRVVRDGYPAVVPETGGRAIESTIAFFPLYPLSVRAADLLLPFSLPLVGILVSLAFGAASVVLVHRLALAVTSPENARRAAVLYCVFPGAFVLSMAYTEGLMVALAAGCLLTLLRGRWLAAGALAALATACRPTGIALVAACAWQAGLAIHQRREWRALMAPLLAPAGMIGFFAFLWARTGEAAAWFRVEEQGWGHGSAFSPTLVIIGRFVRSPFEKWTTAMVVATFVVAAVALIIVLRQRWPSVLVVYSLAIVGLASVSRPDGLRPRDLFTAFPLVLALATVIRGRSFHTAAIGCAWAMTLLLLGHNMFLLAQP